MEFPLIKKDEEPKLEVLNIEEKFKLSEIEEHKLITDIAKTSNKF